jgi:DNA polymerase III subunit delta'
MKFEPLNQINLFGFDKQFHDLVDLYAKKKLPNKIIFSGEKGIGKFTMACHLINYILSLDEDYAYDLKNFSINKDNRSFKLIQNRSNPNFYLINAINEKKNIDVNQIRKLILDLNKSSFNQKPRFVLIDDLELLNLNSINALLKIIEEPNPNINFILINNNKRVLPTLNSRCLNFKVSLSYEKSIHITNNILKEDIFELVNKDLICNYSTPGQLVQLISFSKETGIDLKQLSLKDFLSLILSNKYFKKEFHMKNMIFFLIELYFRINVSSKDIRLISYYYYFLNKIDNVQKYNLDEESLLMEFDYRVLNG